MYASIGTKYVFYYEESMQRKAKLLRYLGYSFNVTQSNLSGNYYIEITSVPID